MTYLKEIKDRFDAFGFKQQQYLFVNDEKEEDIEEEEDEEDEDSDAFEENYFG